MFGEPRTDLLQRHEPRRWIGEPALNLGGLFFRETVQVSCLSFQLKQNFGGTLLPLFRPKIDPADDLPKLLFHFYDCIIPPETVHPGLV